MIRTVGMIAMTNRRRGRPPLHDQNKLEFFVFFRRLKHELTLASLRMGTRCVRAKTTTYPKTLRNYSDICDKEAESDPTFVPFAEMILAGYGIGATQPEEGTRGHCSGWIPTHRL
jgi:hypothetical protein